MTVISISISDDDALIVRERDRQTDRRTDGQTDIWVEKGRWGERAGEKKQSRGKNHQKVGCEIILDD